VLGDLGEGVAVAAVDGQDRVGIVGGEELVEWWWWWWWWWWYGLDVRSGDLVVRGDPLAQELLFAEAADYLFVELVSEPGGDETTVERLCSRAGGCKPGEQPVGGEEALGRVDSGGRAVARPRPVFWLVA
jgi:hypothetical protein